MYEQTYCLYKYIPRNLHMYVHTSWPIVCTYALTCIHKCNIHMALWTCYFELIEMKGSNQNKENRWIHLPVLHTIYLISFLFTACRYGDRSADCGSIMHGDTCTAQQQADCCETCYRASQTTTPATTTIDTCLDTVTIYCIYLPYQLVIQK